MKIDLLKHIPKAEQADFQAGVADIAKSLGIAPIHLLHLMLIESGINPAAINPKGGAAGLIQFMPSTQRELGIKDVHKMSGVQQLPYVLRYFRPWAGKIKNVYDAYMAIFFPAALGKDRDFVIQTKGISAEKIAAVNPIFDLNKDKKITVGEFQDYVFQRFTRMGITIDAPEGSGSVSKKKA